MEILKEFETTLTNYNLTKNTIISYTNDIKAYIQWYLENTDMKIDKNDSQLIKQYITQILNSKKFTINTVNRKINALRKFCFLLYNHDISAELPFLPELNIDIGSVLTEQEVKQLENRINKIKDYTIIEFQLYAGLSVSEICELTISDVSSHIIYIKGSRILPIHERLSNALRTYILHKDINNDLMNNEINLFNSSRGDITPSGIFRIVKKYSTENKDYTPTMLRNTFFYNLLNKDISLNIVYYIMGKKVIYFNTPNYDEVKAAIDMISYI